MAKIVKLGVKSASEYYFENDKIMNENGDGDNLQITGSLAESLGLEDGSKLEQEQMTNLLKGYSADGTEQYVDRLKHSSTGKENAAYDIVFSAPKSVSMLSLTVDARLQEAHNEAVKEVLTYINDNYAKTNAYDQDGNRVLNKGTGLLVATAKHSISRDEDKGIPDFHVHTHSIVFNITKDTTDNKFKALAANDMLRDANKFQEMYRSSLALKVKELGYEIEKHNSQSSAWDIAGIKRENVLHFSQRHNKIVASATTIQEQEHVQHKGKKDKSDLSKKELLESWNKQQQENFGMSFNELKEHCLNNVEKTQNHYENPKEVLQSAMQALTQNEAVIKEEDLLKLSRKISIGEFSDKQLREELSHIKKTGQENSHDIKLLGVDKKGNQLFTTKEMYDLERDNMKMIKNQHDVKPVMQNENATQAIKSFNDKQSWNMTLGQTKAVDAMLTNDKQFLIINGDPGVGKTTLMAAFADATNNRKDLEIKILAPTGKAAKEASQASGLQANTIDSFLLQKRSINDKQKIYIVDESSMLDAQKANALLKIARREHAQVVFVGDQKQLKSIGSGDFFSQIQGHVKSVVITEANRFKTDLQKEVARLANSKKLDKVVDLLDEHKKVIQVDSKPNSKDLSHEQIRDEKKLSLAKEASKIVSQNYKEINAYAADNKQVDAINQQVRQDIGFSEKRGMEFESIKPKSSMNQAHNKAHAGNYALSDVVQVNKSIKGLKKFTEYAVKEIDTHNNKLTLQTNIQDKKSGTSKEHTVQIDARELLSASIGEKSKMEVVEGEKILITRNNKELGVNNGDIGFAKSFNEKKGEITLSINEKEVTINTNEFKNMSYAYATSIHKSQGTTVEKAVLVLDSDNEQQNAYNLGEVGVTRQKHDLILVTDNKEIVKEQLKNEQIKTSTLDHQIDIKSHTITHG